MAIGLAQSSRIRRLASARPEHAGSVDSGASCRLSSQPQRALRTRNSADFAKHGQQHAWPRGLNSVSGEHA
eukprot:7365629-Alexandrium_andersonii.AAC.1